MSDIVVWLREVCPDIRGDVAADTIEQLRAQVASYSLERNIRQMTEKRNSELLAQVQQQAEALRVTREALVRVDIEGHWHSATYRKCQEALAAIDTLLPNTKGEQWKTLI